MRANEAEIAAARFCWEEGARRLAGDRSPGGPLRQRIVDAAVDELRRRVGVTFTVADLAEEYRDAPRWFAPLAQGIAPGDPRAWDQATTLDAAFGWYVRLAVDAPGRGRR